MIRSPSLLSPYSIPHERSLSYAIQTHTNTYQRKLNFNFLGGSLKKQYLYDTPIKEEDFKFYAQILLSKKLEAVISHEEGFLFLEGKSSLENRKYSQSLLR